MSNLCSPKLDHTEQKWVADPAVFDLEIKFKPGRENTKADALSRQVKVPKSLSHEDVFGLNLMHGKIMWQELLLYQLY